MAMPKQKPGKSKQDYGTPPEFLTAVKLSIGIEDFDIDLAASPENAVTAAYYTEEDNSLVQPWKIGDGWNWLNPPFKNIGEWVEKAYKEMHAAEGAQTAVLIPAGVGANWWRDWVHEKASVLFLNGRITFLGTPPNPKTGKPDAYPKDCALLLYSPEDYAAIQSGDNTGYDVWSWTK